MKIEQIKNVINSTKESDTYKETTCRTLDILKKYKKKDTLVDLGMRDIALSMKCEYKDLNVCLHILNKYGIRPFNPVYFNNDTKLSKLGDSVIDVETGEIFERGSFEVKYSISDIGKKL